MNEKFLDLAFKYAEQALRNNEVPIGAVIVKDKKVISYGFNQKEESCDPTNHAEIIAIKKACKKLKNWRLIDCDIYLTLDPCPMCASAIKQARIRNVYSASNNLDDNNIMIIREIFKKDKTNPAVNFITNLSVEKTKKFLNNFFLTRRKD